ncbi:histidine phosphatase family protein [Staphylococcus croceilyticus]|uniref:phosphoglycerate mutase (2,3-diphosphoglycerate-dependent) n=1 Tax=Staphylococcus croceilyticus TaxID=319942 RepID=A0ABY2KIM7_9STAP|nr:histidine phosphatase family protein [Staphylococcus croceilyticus]PNZ67443.1 histidine phosphatase family protein [Staphylococcus croceilyticus]TGA80800.1 histidine phosphatase family protein [Staphylococcus croceilyticus]
MKLYLVRHGESQSNYDNKHHRAYFCGQLDVHLTKKGIEGARSLESYFKDMNIDHVYVSDLTRTIETYNNIFPYDIPTTVTSGLRERSLGVFEGEYKDKLMKDAQYHQYFNHPEYKDFRHSFTQKAPKGESYGDVLNRIRLFFENEVSQDSETIVIVAHQVVIRCMLVYFGMLTEKEALDQNIENCKPIYIEI